MNPAPIRILQLTDLHLYGAANGQLRGVATLPALESAIAAAWTEAAPWQAVLLSGDLVQDDGAGYARVRELFGGSQVPVYCLPGNHDEIPAMQAALAGPPFQICGTAEHGSWTLVLLDSYQHGMASGRLSPAELQRLDLALTAAVGRHVLVCLHHHPVATGSRWLDAVALDNAEQLFDVLDRHANVRVLLWGHVHQVFDGVRRGVRLLSTPATCAQFKPGSDSFAVDLRPPGFRWLDLYPDGSVDTSVVWVGEAAQHATTSRARPG